jgi:hypothetical protein
MRPPPFSGAAPQQKYYGFGTFVNEYVECSVPGAPSRVNPPPGRRVLLLVTDSEDHAGAGHEDGRLLALRCLGIPQVATRTPMSRRRALRYRLAAYRVRLRPGTTAELAALVLRMSDDIDTRERMLDAALRDLPAAGGLR